MPIVALISRAAVVFPESYLLLRETARSHLRVGRLFRMPTVSPGKTRTSSATAKKPRAARSKRSRTPERVVIDVEQSGDWMPVADMMKTALDVLEQDKDVTLNVNNIDHLDASALQVLLALDAAGKNRGRHLDLINASQNLRQWFEYSGTADQFFETGVGSNG